MSEKLIKDRDCVRCEKVLDCKGKEPGKLCLWLKERKREKTAENVSAK